MNDVSKSLLSAAGVIAAAGMVLLGANQRAKMDGGPLAASNLSTLMASRDVEAVQVNVSATDFYSTLSEKLKQEYVEPVGDDMKLATGAVRGMVASLADPDSLYMDKSEFTAFLNARQGKYEGIGADFVLSVPKSTKLTKEFLQPTPGQEEGTAAEPQVTDSADMPRLTVSSVVPGGPADLAGVKAGDLVDTIDEHWVYNSAPLRKFRAAQKQYEAKKMSLEALNKLRNELRTKFDKAILPIRARQMLFLGSAGTVNVTWQRGNATRTTKIDKAICQAPGFRVENGVIELPFTADSVAGLQKEIAGKTDIKIDLRGNTRGDFEVMKKLMAVLAPSGEYGVFAKEGKTGTVPFKVTNGNAKPPKMTLLVDGTTRGAAEILALALSSKGLAKLSGSEMGGDRSVYDVISLPGGTGYTLVTSVYKPSLPVKKEAKG